MSANNPVIIVGAGRSGTTLLNSALGEHPDIYMAGETSFLLPRMWQAFFEKPAYVRNYRLGKLSQALTPEWRSKSWFDFWQNGISRDLSRVPGVENIEQNDNERVARVLGQALADMLIPDNLRRSRWGFKEIWNGGDTFDYDWSLYRMAFPDAAYVQCVRHPLTFATSYFSNHRKDPTTDDVTYILALWVRMVTKARRLADAHYIEIRYEDLAASPTQTLDRLLRFLGLAPDNHCSSVMAIDHLRSSYSCKMPTITRAHTDAVPGLAPLLDDLHYEM